MDLLLCKKGIQRIETIPLCPTRLKQAITGPVVTELIQGYRTEKEKRELLMAFESIYLLRITDALWLQASDLAFLLRKKRITVSVIDALIASVAIEYDAYLFHSDKDYDLISEHFPLKIYKYYFKPSKTRCTRTWNKTCFLLEEVAFQL